MTPETAADWQKNPFSVTTDRIQLWSKSGVMLTALLSLADARELVYTRRAFVISSQAIGEYDANLSPQSTELLHELLDEIETHRLHACSQDPGSQWSAAQDSAFRIAQAVILKALHTDRATWVQTISKVWAEINTDASA